MAPARLATRLRTEPSIPSLPGSKAMPSSTPWLASSQATVPPSSRVGHLGSLTILMSMRGWPTCSMLAPMCIFRWVFTSMARSTRTQMPDSEMFSMVPFMPTPSKSPVSTVTVAPSRGLIRARGFFRRSARAMEEGTSRLAEPGLASSSRVGALKRRPSWMKSRLTSPPLSTVREPWGATMTLSSMTETKVAGTSRPR